MTERTTRPLRGILAGAVAVALLPAAAQAEGDLFIYNWTDYTAPELVEKFEAETGISVTLDVYDSNETLLAKLQAGNTGYDIVVPTHNFTPILIEEGLLQPVGVKDLDGYSNLKPVFQMPAWDPEGQYVVPWMTGTTAFTVNTDVVTGDVDSYEVFFNPPEEARGRVGVFNSADEVISMTLIYLGKEQCTTAPDDLRAVYEVLEAQKPHVLTYSSDGILERLLAEDAVIHNNWNGYSTRARAENPAMRYVFPKEGVMTWADTVGVPAGAPNVENAKKWLSFIMQPENIAINSNFAGYANGVQGSEEFMNEDLKASPEITVPDDVPQVFSQVCGQEYIERTNNLWTRLLQ